MKINLRNEAIWSWHCLMKMCVLSVWLFYYIVLCNETVPTTIHSMMCVADNGLYYSEANDLLCVLLHSVLPTCCHPICSTCYTPAPYTPFYHCYTHACWSVVNFDEMALASMKANENINQWKWHEISVISNGIWKCEKLMKMSISAVMSMAWNSWLAGSKISCISGYRKAAKSQLQCGLWLMAQWPWSQLMKANINAIEANGLTVWLSISMAMRS